MQGGVNGNLLGSCSKDVGSNPALALNQKDI